MKKRLLIISLFALIHFIVFAVIFINSLYFIFPDEPGFDPHAHARSRFFSDYILPVVGFPFIDMIFNLKVPLPKIFHGQGGWLLFAANSYVWGLTGYWLMLKLRKKSV